MTTLLDLKLDRAFGQLDFNANGYIDHDDIVALVARLVAGFRESPGARRAGRWRWASTTSGSRFSMPPTPTATAGLRRTSGTVGMVEAFVEPADGFDEHLRPAVEAVMHLADTDGDGRIGMAEFKILQKAFGTKPVGVKAAFAHLDADGDGTLSVTELIDAAREFYTGKGGTAGDWLFGPLA